MKPRPGLTFSRRAARDLVIVFFGFSALTALAQNSVIESLTGPVTANEISSLKTAIAGVVPCAVWGSFTPRREVPKNSEGGHRAVSGPMRGLQVHEEREDRLQVELQRRRVQTVRSHSLHRRHRSRWL
jgi:hypothetical protein